MKILAQSLGEIEVPGELLDLGKIVQNILMLAIFAAGIFFLLQIVIGGISWIGAGGDEKALTAARGRITNAVIGFIIVIAAFAITVIVTGAFGINLFQEGGVTIIEE